MKGFILLLVFFAGSFVRQTLPVSRHRFVVIAHRGDHEHAPENTVAAVRDAIRCGVDYVELDLRMTRDGYLVADWERLLGGHIQGIQTDHPEELMDYLRKAGVVQGKAGHL